MLIYALLALSGGCMDAYSYLCRGNVFANAQTGNLLLLGVRLAERDWSGALRYLWPILAFTAGILLSDALFRGLGAAEPRWQRMTVLTELLVLFGVCWLPQRANAPANALISFACGLQVESFRSLQGNSIATTMCIGNLRSGTYYLNRFRYDHESEDLRRAALYYGVIVFFIIGAVAESCLVRQYEERALLLSAVLLLIALAGMLAPQKPDETRP